MYMYILIFILYDIILYDLYVYIYIYIYIYIIEGAGTSAEADSDKLGENDSHFGYLVLMAAGFFDCSLQTHQK